PSSPSRTRACSTSCGNRFSSKPRLRRCCVSFQALRASWSPYSRPCLENAVRICEAKFGTMYRYNGDMFYPTAVLNPPPTLSEFLQQRGAFQPPSATPPPSPVADEKCGAQC